MASVAICPHCYLQLVVPDGIEPDERVECPTCAKQFGLDQAVLRAIPEVVRRAQAAEPATPVEIMEAVTRVEVASDDRETPSLAIDEIKARIESEIAENGLVPGTSALLPLELPNNDEADQGVFESASESGVAESDPAALFQNSKTVPEFLSLDDDSESRDEIDVEIEVEELIDEIDEPDDSRVTKPTVRTLAELMPPRDASDEFVQEVAEEAPGPSFDLPNVPLVPNNGATVEIDPDASFGSAAETEFELDNVDFESMPAEESVTDEVTEDSEPVFQEPTAREASETPFVLPGIPPRRKRRSVFRTLVGTALGALLGLSLGYFILLYALGPEGDLLQVAKYIPSAVLPKSFHHELAPIADAGRPSPTVQEATAEPANAAPSEESANIPAGFTEESPARPEKVTAVEPAGDDRYSSEPAPLEEPAAAPIETEAPITAIPPLPIRGPTITVDQLATALEAGKAAQTGLVTGDLSDAAFRRAKGASYEKLSALAEALTFVDPSSPSIESQDAADGAGRLFREILSDAHTRNEIARIVSIWINSPHRKNSGIFLAGTISGGQIAGDVYEYKLATEAGGDLTILMHEPLDPSVESSDRPVGIVGTIVENPRDTVTGYQGTAERAIWGARTIPLD
jgi:hypothetical protein